MASYGFLWLPVSILPRSGPLLIRAEAPAAHTPRRFVARRCKNWRFVIGLPQVEYHGIPIKYHGNMMKNVIHHEIL